MSVLNLILDEDPDTRLSALLHPFDFYDLSLALEDRGVKVQWETLLAMESCEEVQSLCREVEQC